LSHESRHFVGGHLPDLVDIDPVVVMRQQYPQRCDLAPRHITVLELEVLRQ
jgi:hypothetical protein